MLAAIKTGLDWLAVSAQFPPDEVLKLLIATVAGITIAWGMMKARVK